MDSKTFRDQLAAEFISILESEGLEWKKGWNDVSIPYNETSKAHYKGINLFRLLLSMQQNKYNDPRWLTFNQIQELNKNRKHEDQLSVAGQKATPIEYYTGYDPINKKTFNLREKNTYLNDHPELTAEDIKIIAKVYYVFNCSQIKNYPKYNLNQQNQQLIDTELIQNLADQMGVKILHDSYTAFYRPNEDAIHLPDKEAFHSQHDYDFTLLHELSHSTGHETRLNRDIKNSFGSEKYAYEELIAEMSACFFGKNLTDKIPEEHLENHKAYIKSWISILKNNPSQLFKAIKEAQQVADYMDQQLSIRKSLNTDLKVIIESTENTQLYQYLQAPISYQEFVSIVTALQKNTLLNGNDVGYEKVHFQLLKSGKVMTKDEFDIGADYPTPLFFNQDKNVAHANKVAIAENYSSPNEIISIFKKVLSPLGLQDVKVQISNMFDKKSSLDNKIQNAMKYASISKDNIKSTSSFKLKK